MAWAAELLRKDNFDGFINFIVQFADGVTTFNEPFRTQGSQGTEALKQAIYVRLAELDKLSSIDIPVGEKDFTPAPRPVKPPQTQEDIDFTAWHANLGQLRTLLVLVDIGVISDTHTKVAALRTAVYNDFQEVFLSRLGVK